MATARDRHYYTLLLVKPVVYSSILSGGRVELSLAVNTF
jgi:hypothetical protein